MHHECYIELMCWVYILYIYIPFFRQAVVVCHKLALCMHDWPLALEL